MKISIITVCLNASSTIRRTIESVLSQRTKPYEYIVVDGGSTDGTLEIIKGYGTAITRLISEKDKGISDAFNKGIAMATGDWIGILNADDWYEPNTLQKIAENQTKADIVHGKIQYWAGSQKGYSAGGDHSLLKREMTLHHPTVFVRKSFYDAHGLFKLEYRFAMDYEIMLRFALNGARFCYIPDILANMSFDGASDKNWKNAIKETKKAKLENGQPKLPSERYYWKQLARTFVARYLNKTGFSGIVAFYRKHFALVKKN